MDWVSIIITLATASFLIPILKDFQRKTAEMTKKLSALGTQIREVEESNAKDKEEETRVSAELKKVEREMAELEKESNELRKAIELKKKKR